MPPRLSHYNLFCCIFYAKPAKLAKAICDHLCDLSGLGENSKLLMAKNRLEHLLISVNKNGKKIARETGEESTRKKDDAPFPQKRGVAGI